jgi:hypothetical protein
VQVIDTLEGRRLHIHQEFNALSDFIWKTPRLLEDERRREDDKLFAYFPDEGDHDTRQRNADLRKLRAYLEGVKLAVHFPEYMAKSNLFMAASAFEFHLLGICEDVQVGTGQKIEATKGQGISRFLRYLRTAGLDPAKIDLYEQVDAILALRNALLHAFGDLKLSREAGKIVSIVRALKYIEPARRKGGGVIDERGRPEAEIVNDQLQISNHFAFRASAYFSHFLMAQSAHVQAKFGVIR